MTRYGTRGHPGELGIRRHVSGPHGASTNTRVGTDDYAWKNHGTRSDKGAGPNAGTAPQGRQWRHMGKLPDVASMIDDGSVIDDGASGDCRLWSDYGAGSKEAAIAYAGGRRDRGIWMPDAHGLPAQRDRLLKPLLARIVGANCDMEKPG